VILVHSLSRFFRDQFQLEFYVRRLAKNGVRLVSITQELGDDPMSNMIRQIMALFDEYQSKENAKHTLRAMKENARQGFWNGTLTPIGHRIVEVAEQHGHRTKKTQEIDPFQAETVRLIFRLAGEGDGNSGPMASSRSPSISTPPASAPVTADAGARLDPQGPDAHDLHWPPPVQHEVLEDARERKPDGIRPCLPEPGQFESSSVTKNISCLLHVSGIAPTFAKAAVCLL
jgi:hypothetical protein